MTVLVSARMTVQTAVMMAIRLAALKLVKPGRGDLS